MAVEDALQSRAALLAALRSELVGPDPKGLEIDCGQDVTFPAPSGGERKRGDGAANTPEAYRPYRQAGSGEEILSHLDKPMRRYGVGVLYPAQTGPVAGEGETETDEVEFSESGPSEASEEAIAEKVEGMSGRLRSARRTSETDDFDVSLANSFQPSSMGISFLVELPEGSRLVLAGCGGRYLPLKVKIGEADRVWHRREPWSISCICAVADIPASSGRSRWPIAEVHESNLEGLDACIEVFVRPNPAGGVGHLVTAVLLNRERAAARPTDAKCMFQCELSVSPERGARVLPYPTLRENRVSDEEEQAMDLLYRDRPTYAVGHGCAADWSPDELTGEIALRADVLPSFETPSVSAGASDGSDGIPIRLLTDLSDGKGLESLQELTDKYERWIADCRAAAEGLGKRFKDPAELHLRNCDESLARMRTGLDLLRNDDRVRQAFELANAAILLQQAAGLNEVRSAGTDKSRRFLAFAKPYARPNPELLESAGRGRWFPFQAAFLLLSLCSVHDPDDDYRECVDLIWFPTGGGKTEAYLGVAAFYLFLRRLQSKTDTGTGVLMRYTLRLLTTDQFQRASRLLCAMEVIRRRSTDALGDGPFTIGLWVGGSSTPNRRTEAKRALSDLRSSKKKGTRNPFLVDSCPWCGAEMGPTQARLPKNLDAALGYKWDGELATVVFQCPDGQCDFHSGLPVAVIDEDLYEFPPSLLIGTVDKFARLSWTDETRGLFGLGPDGQRREGVSPPGLIIQDELHLISGPLGSMVGLFETVIERLCTAESKPKIICSTATIRRYSEQVRGLYGRESSAVFPPSALSADDSFFARVAVDTQGKAMPGRLYVGVHAPGLQSMQTAQVRTISALLQAARDLPEDLRDPWWTPLTFFNSLRELGTTLSLVQSDIPDYLEAIRRRRAMPWAELRLLENPIELTGRVTSEEVPRALAALKQRYSAGKSNAVDLCLASNMVEVGVDVPRLSLMVVVGQPKSTSAYIQATGRIGRNWRKQPGLVVTIYGASKPRDRSHFEKFRTYHERLYAQVEPLSVTPMSDPALDRALHAVMLSFVRQFSPEDLSRSPRPYSEWVDLLEEFGELLAARSRVVAPHQTAAVRLLLQERMDEWRRWNRAEWGRPFNRSEEIPLMVSAGSYVPPLWDDVVWKVPTSLRNVDQECEIEVPITDLSLEGGTDE